MLHVYSEPGLQTGTMRRCTRVDRNEVISGPMQKDSRIDVDRLTQMVAVTDGSEEKISEISFDVENSEIRSGRLVKLLRIEHTRKVVRPYVGKPRIAGSCRISIPPI